MLATGSAVAAPAVLYQENGQSIDIDVVGVDRSGVHWRLPSGGSTQTYPHDRIDHVAFSPTPLWEEAMEAYDEGRIEEAILKFQAIAKDRTSHYYPAPGNFGSLALRRLVDCYQKRLDAEAVAVAVARLEDEPLPAHEKNFSPLLECWVAVGSKQWKTALEKAEAVELDPIDPQVPTLAYLKGTALQGLGREDEALIEFSKVYTLGLGAEPRLGRESVRKAAEILARVDAEDRATELTAQVQLYASLYGRGTLWEDAGDPFVSLAEAELDLIKTGSAAKPSSEGLDVAKLKESIYVVGRRDGLDPINNVQRVDGAWKFDGKDDHILLRDPDNNISLKGLSLIIRGTIQTNSPNAVIVTTGDQTNGFSAFIQEGQLKFAWRRDKKLKVISSDTKVTGGKTQFEIVVHNGKRCNITIDGEPKAKGENIDDLLNTQPPGPLVIGGDPEGRNVAGFAAANYFEGLIHELMIGTDATPADIRAANNAQQGNAPVK